MQFNYYFLKKLSKALRTRLMGKKIIDCFSQNKNEILICLEGQLGENFIIRALLDGEISVLSFPEEFARAKRNSTDLFGEILDNTVIDVIQLVNERSFYISFKKEYQLLFKLHGNRANLILFHKGRLVSMFKHNLANDHQIDFKDLSKTTITTDAAIIASQFNLKVHYPTFDKYVYHQLKILGFNTLTDDNAKLLCIKSIVKELEDDYHYVVSNKTETKLTLFDNTNTDGMRSFIDPIEGSNYLAGQLMAQFYFHKEKNRLVAALQSGIQKTTRYIEKTSEKLQLLLNQRQYDELANILMANLHLPHDRNLKKVVFEDFYRDNQPIEITIKTKMSLQDNAAIYYKKSKNQSIEIDNLKNNIATKELKLLELSASLSQIEICEDFKSLKPFIKVSHTEVQKESSPFIEMTIDGYEIFIGRNAKNNDLLTMKYAHKNDLWLHARDVSGSHVIIRDKGKQIFPMGLIEKVAAFAAWHSKRKSDTLCPVIYTQKKYVRKPKGAIAGLVVLQQEKVILVKPLRELPQ